MWRLCSSNSPTSRFPFGDDDVTRLFSHSVLALKSPSKTNLSPDMKHLSIWTATSLKNSVRSSHGSVSCGAWTRMILTVCFWYSILTVKMFIKFDSVTSSTDLNDPFFRAIIKPSLPCFRFRSMTLYPGISSFFCLSCTSLFVSQRATMSGVSSEMIFRRLRHFEW